MISKPLVDSSISPYFHTRPLELYVFIDPTCHNCWYLQPILRKLQIDFERFFTLRVILRTSLSSLNATQCRSLPNAEKDATSEHPAFPSIAIKAAEFQGKRAGFKFISKLFEYTYLKEKNVTNLATLVEIAKKVKLDIDEFIKDFNSKNVHRSLQVDLYMAKEMEVEEAPTFVFFNGNIEDEGLKISGLYSYDIYKQIIEELLGQSIFPEPPPTIEELFQRFGTLTTKEVADIYDTTEQAAERELKKRLLQQIVEKSSMQNITLWRLKEQPQL